MSANEIPGRKPAGVAAIAAAVTFFISTASFNAPRHETDEQVLAWWQESSNRNTLIVSTFCLLIAGLSLLVFTSYLAERLRAAVPSSLAPRLVRAAGIAVAVMLFVSGTTGAIARGPAIDDEPVPGVDVLRYFSQIRYVATGVYAMGSAALLIGCVSFLALRYGALPKWLGWFGVVMAALIVVAVAAFIGQYAIPALLFWLIATGIVLLRRSGTPIAESQYTVTAHPVTVP